MRLLLIAALVICCDLRLSAQRGCDCLPNFDSVTTKIRANYAGYPHRIQQKGQAAHDQLLKKLRAQAQKTTTPKACFRVMAQYIRFFGDLHLGLSYLNDNDWDLTYDQSSVEVLKKNIRARPAGGLAGIWQTPNGNVTMAIVADPKQPGRSKSVIIASKDPQLTPGLVYFTVEKSGNQYAIAYYNVFSSSFEKAILRGNLLKIGGEWWVRTFPQQPTEAEMAIVTRAQKVVNGFFFEKIEPDVAYLKVESFANNDDALAAFVQKHDSVIRKTPYLIVDLRDNGGGNYGWINFVPYCYTQPFVQGVSYYRMSPDNRAKVEQILQSVVTMEVTPDMKKYFPDDYMARKRQEAARLATFDGAFFPSEGVNIPYDSVLTYPKRVALLVNRGSGSSVEYFLNLSKQSKKTVSLGQMTMGIMDNVGTEGTPLPCPSYFLSVPFERSSWTTQYTTNEVGMKPDVLIQHLPEEKWVDYTIQHLRKSKK